MNRSLLLVAALCGFAATSSAQLAQSPSFRLDDFAMAGGGGGAASSGFASFFALQPMSGGEVVSPSFRAEFGFLAAWDPRPTNAPVIFGVVPDCGSTLGGAGLTISGLNFDKFGTGPSVTVSVGGVSASTVSVGSDTLLTCVTAPGSAGDKDVTVSNSFGSDTLAGAFHYTAGLLSFGSGTPGCAGPQTVGATSCPTLGNAAFQLTCDHAPPNSLGLGIVTNAPDLAGTDLFGLGVLLHVDLLTSVEVYTLNFTSDASGFATAPAPIPSHPFYLGLTYYAQAAVWVWGSACSLPPYGLSSSKGLKLTIE